MTQTATKTLSVAEMLSMYAPLISMVQLHAVVYLEVAINQGTGQLLGQVQTIFRGLRHVLETL